MPKRIRAAIKVDFGNNLRLGAGKINLLKLIKDQGSISGAARAMEMSYRRAWLLIEELNDIFAIPVVETAAGGSGGGGAKLTPLGAKLIELYDELQKDADALVQAKFAKLKT